MQITPKKARIVLVTANLKGNESNSSMMKIKAKLF